MPGAPDTQIAIFTNSTLTSTQAPAILNTSGTGVVTLIGSSVTGNGTWLDVTAAPTVAGVALAPSILNLTADASRLTGAAVTEAGATSDVTLRNRTIWNMTGSSNLTDLVNIASTISFSGPTGDPTLLSSYKTLTVNNYTGTGGTIGLNTFLGADNSPSDKLVINGGTATGSSTILHITNTGGPGAETTGNGIQVVQTMGTALRASGAFTLGNGELGAGAFPPAPPREPLPPGVFPIIGPELATYGVVQPIARQLGLTTLGTLHERMGDTLEEPCTAATPGVIAPKAPLAPNCTTGIWGRVFGQQINDRFSAFADPRASGQLVGLQTGFDFWRGSLIAGHRDTAGLYFGYGNGHVGVDGLVTNPEATAFVLGHTGTVNLNGYSLGGYWTHYGPTGWYIDTVVQGTFYEGNATTEFASLPLHGAGVITSVEAGYPIPLPWFGPRFVLEPQGQIIWQQVSFDQANDGLGPVGLGTTNGATGRLGRRGQWTIPGPNGQVWQPPYVRATVWRDWGAEATTTFGIDPVPLLVQATRLEFAGGVTAKLSANWSLYAQGGYQFAAGEPNNGIRRDGVMGDIGMRYNW